VYLCVCVCMCICVYVCMYACDVAEDQDFGFANLDEVTFVLIVVCVLHGDMHTSIQNT
jgi:hypothetical protein